MQERLKGYLNACNDNNININPGYEVIQKLLNKIQSKDDSTKIVKLKAELLRQSSVCEV